MSCSWCEDVNSGGRRRGDRGVLGVGGTRGERRGSSCERWERENRSAKERGRGREKIN